MSLAEKIASARFASVRFAPSYSMEEVDDFLTLLTSRLDPSGTVRSADAQAVEEMVLGAQFSTVRLRPGYDMEEVDLFLDEVVQEVRRVLGRPERW